MSQRRKISVTPMLLCLWTALIMAFLVYTAPIFAEMYEAMELPIPKFTQLLVNISIISKNHPFILLPILLSSAAIFIDRTSKLEELKRRKWILIGGGINFVLSITIPVSLVFPVVVTHASKL